MKDIAQHTPLPWKLENGGVPIIFGDGIEIAEFTCDAIDPPNAAFIVTACNNHYKLLASLKEIVSYLDSEYGLQEVDRNCPTARVVITNAEGQ